MVAIDYTKKYSQGGGNCVLKACQDKGSSFQFKLQSSLSENGNNKQDYQSDRECLSSHLGLPLNFGIRLHRGVAILPSKPTTSPKGQFRRGIIATK